MNKKELIKKKIIRNLAGVGLVLIVLMSLVFLVSALTSEDRASLQSELDNLTAELNTQGYLWIIEHNLNIGSNI
ncbi:MAG: hypothetical protein AABW67_04465 [Nanoarchaeota archaeon]